MTSRNDALSKHLLLGTVSLAAAVAAGSVAAWLPRFASNLTRGVTAGVLGGNDFAMYYTASALGRAGRWVDAYSLEGLAEEMGLRLGAASFAYPPMLAQALGPLTSADYATALAIWFVAAAAVVVFGMPLVFGWKGVASLAAMGFPLYVALRFGQFVPFAVGALLLATLAVRRDRIVVAGIAVGVLAIKPQFLIGVVLVALLDEELRPLLSGIAISVGSIVAISMILDPGAWRAFLGGLSETAQPNVSSSWDYSLLEVLSQLPAIPMTIAYLVIAAALTWLCVKGARSTPHIEEKLALGLALSVALSPRMVVYDWTLLAIVGAWLLSANQSPRVRWGAMLVTFGSLSGHRLSPVNIGWLALALALTLAATSLFSPVREEVGRD